MPLAHNVKGTRPIRRLYQPPSGGFLFERNLKFDGLYSGITNLLPQLALPIEAESAGIESTRGVLREGVSRRLLFEAVPGL
jgi:hypothetical protein